MSDSATLIMLIFILIIIYVFWIHIPALLMISIAMGIVFEIPVVSWILGRMGILRSSVMRKYRRHVIVALLIIAAIITPTSDAFTLFLVALPMWLLYEVSILIVRR